MIGLVIFIHIHHEQMLVIVVPVLNLDVLVQRALRTIGFIAFINVTGVVPSYLHCSPPHSFLTLLVLGI
jgi:hypothetical protein